MTYNFDKIINRTHTNAMSIEGFRGYLFGEYENLVFDYPDHEIIKMWVADMEFETAPEIIEGLHKRIDHGILGYTGIFEPSYNKALLDWIERRHGYRYQGEHIVTSKGVIPALFYLTKALHQPGDKTLIMTPSYAFFKHAADANRLEIVYTDLIEENGHFSIDFEDIATKVGDPNLKSLIFCNPHNPTGRLWTIEELKKLGELCMANDVLIISDEIHCDILRKNAVFTPFQKVFPNSEQIITCISASKTFNLAGLLFANVIIPNDVIRFQWQADHLPIENPLSIVAYEAAYTHGQPWLTALTNYLDENFKVVDIFLKKYLPAARFTIPESTYLAWIDISAYVEGIEDITLFFVQKGGILLEGDKMFVANAEGYIRLNLACPRSQVKEGLDRIYRCLAHEKQKNESQ